MTVECRAHGQTDVGRLRQANEDRFVVEKLSDGSTLLVVCDGMGGHEGGQIASQVAATAIVDGIRGRMTLPPPQALFESISLAHEVVRREALARSLAGMGTTAVAAWVIQGRAWVGWVGDSRLYQLREGRVVEKTEDHTKVQRLISEGRLAPADAVTHPEAHVLERALGGSGEVQPEVWNEALELQQGDVLLLCTDGLHDMLNDALLYRLMEGKDPEQATLALIERANANGGHDNATAVVALAGPGVIPALPELEDTESGDRPPSKTGLAAVGPKPSRSSRTWEAERPRGGVPTWALAAVAVVALGLGLALGVHLGHAPPAPSVAAPP